MNTFFKDISNKDLVNIANVYPREFKQYKENEINCETNSKKNIYSDIFKSIDKFNIINDLSKTDKKDEIVESKEKKENEKNEINCETNSKKDIYSDILQSIEIANKFFTTINKQSKEHEIKKEQLNLLKDKKEEIDERKKKVKENQKFLEEFNKIKKEIISLDRIYNSRKDECELKLKELKKKEEELENEKSDLKKKENKKDEIKKKNQEEISNLKKDFEELEVMKKTNKNNESCKKYENINKETFQSIQLIEEKINLFTKAFFDLKKIFYQLNENILEKEKQKKETLDGLFLIKSKINRSKLINNEKKYSLMTLIDDSHDNLQEIAKREFKFVQQIKESNSKIDQILSNEENKDETDITLSKEIRSLLISIDSTQNEIESLKNSIFNAEMRF